MTKPANGAPQQDEVSLGEAKALIKALAAKESLLLVSPPGIGKTDVVKQAAAEAGLPFHSLLGTQIAPEDVSGVPSIVDGRAVFHPPRVLLPPSPKPFCLLLDELPACTPDVQKAFYSILLERRIGEHLLPPGTWVVAAGNRQQDRAQVRALSSALVNRLFVIPVRVDVAEWLAYAQENGVHSDVIAFISLMPQALMRAVPDTPTPFSTPRAWTSLSSALIELEKAGLKGKTQVRVLAHGRVSPEDAAVFSAMMEARLGDVRPPLEYIHKPELLPKDPTACWFVLSAIRQLVMRREVKAKPSEINRFLLALPAELRFTLFVGHVREWARLGAERALYQALTEATGL